MEKLIKINYEDNSAKIICEDREEIFINKTINAKQIWNILGYNKGDTYSLEEIDYEKIPSSNREPIKLLFGLINSIISEINELNRIDVVALQREKLNKNISNEE